MTWFDHHHRSKKLASAAKSSLRQGDEAMARRLFTQAAQEAEQALAQVSRDPTAGRFPLVVWDRASIRNGEVSVAFKPVDGSIDRAAGIVWRYRDPNNYYIVRANALENNVVLYKVEAGTRLSIAPKGLPSRSYGAKHEVPSARWM